MGENRIMQDLYEENQKLKARVAELEAQHFSECAQIAHYDDELKALLSKVDIGAAKPKDYLDLLNEWAKARKLLKVAVDDFTAIAEVHAAASPILCPQYGKYMKAIDVRTRKWQYANEALKLIGEDGEQND